MDKQEVKKILVREGRNFLLTLVVTYVGTFVSVCLRYKSLPSVAGFKFFNLFFAVLAIPLTVLIYIIRIIIRIRIVGKGK